MFFPNPIRCFSHRSRACYRHGPGFGLLISLIVSPLVADAKDGDVFSHRIGRYVEVSTASTPIQKEPLIEVVSFKTEVQTVGDAVREVLVGTGYRVDESVGLPGFDLLELPRVHRSFQDTQVIEILHALAGPVYRIIIDPVTRMITFQLMMEPNIEE